MTIFLDLELEEDFTPANQSREAKEMCRIVKAFYESRFNVLKDEIDKQEEIQYQKKEFAYVVIPILYIDNPIQYFNYSSELAEKMKSCYSPEDAVLLDRQLKEGLNTFNN